MKFRKLPPLNELAAFEAIARHRSFTKASKELFLTPSAISQRLRQLEEHLDAQLFVRTRRSVQLTADGARYLQVVRDALSKLALASEGFSETETKQVRLSIVPALASNWLIRKLRAFYRQFPNIDLDIQSAIAMANVGAGEVDIAIRWGKGDWPGLEKFKLFSDELLAVCSKGYLREMGTLRYPVDLRNAVLLRNSIQPWKPWFERAGLDWLEPVRGPLFNDSTLALQAAVDGHGVALGRRMLVEHLLEQGSLVQLFDISAPMEEAFFVVYLKDSLQRAEVAAFIDWIKSLVEQERRASKSEQVGEP
jgi:LysR family transcriptional regulator, glycine cleavage system transcriptional activator